MQVITRNKWNARPPHSTPVNLPWAMIDALVIHYSAAFTDEFPDYAARVRGIQNYHMDTKGWNDIAYNFLVSRDGDVFEGRGWNVMSAATLNNNSHTQAFCFLGADKVGRDDVTDKGRKSISDLIDTAMRMAGKKLLVKGHRDYVSTDCPGDELYAFVSSEGWKGYEHKESYPDRFFLWAEWRLGEGQFKQYGKANESVRPKQIPERIPDEYWDRLKKFLAARNK